MFANFFKYFSVIGNFVNN